MTDIDKMLTERGTRYGEFESHAMVTQQLKNVMQAHPNWKSLDEHHKEALDMIQHKIGRILNGDPTYRDSWDDIAGYARLVPPIDEKRSQDDTEIHEEEPKSNVIYEEEPKSNVIYEAVRCADCSYLFSSRDAFCPKCGPPP